MSDYIYYLLGYTEDISPEPRQVILRNLLMKQIVKSNIILKPILKRETVEEKLKVLLRHFELQKMEEGKKAES